MRPSIRNQRTVQYVTQFIHTQIPLSVNSLNWARTTCVRCTGWSDCVVRTVAEEFARRVVSITQEQISTAIHSSIASAHLWHDLHDATKVCVLCKSKFTTHTHTQTNRNTHKNTHETCSFQRSGDCAGAKWFARVVYLQIAQHNVVCRLRCAWIFRTMDIFKPHSTQMQTTCGLVAVFVDVRFFLIYASVTPATPKNRSQIERVRYGRKKTCLIVIRHKLVPIKMCSFWLIHLTSVCSIIRRNSVTIEHKNQFNLLWSIRLT